MTFKQYLIVMLVGTACAWLSWLISLYTTDPTETSVLGFMFFYLTLFIALVGSLTIFGSAIRVFLKKPNVISRQAFIAFRHGFLFSLLIIGSLILISFDVLRWWSIILLITVLVCFELFFLTSRRPRPPQKIE
ncbi:MAG: hypothetical protein ABIH67_00505 [Candidatus Uhrbacteria bacterium]